MEPLAVELDVEPGVELIHWPADEQLRRSLARAGVPRLLLLSGYTTPPADLAFDEDWIREPFVLEDARLCSRRIAESVRSRTTPPPWIDDDRVLHRGLASRVLTASEAVVAETLLASSGHVVSRTTLESRLWPGGVAPSDRAIDSVIYRLRCHVRDLGLLIRTARGEGFVLLGAP